MKKVKLIALLAAVITAVCLYLFLHYLSKESHGPQVEVVTAVVNIPMNTMITAEMVALTNFPEKGAHPDAIKDTKLVIGKAANSDILAGEQILGGKIIVPGESGNNTLAYSIKPGMRAITVGVSQTSGLAGMLKPRDRIDIIAEFESENKTSVTTLVAENITILAVDSIMAKSGKNTGKDGLAVPYATITLQVTPQDAMRISMTEAKGSLRALLRSPLDNTITKTPSIKLDSIAGM